jgi:hypothetical protein
MVILTKPKCLKPREIPRVVKGNQIPKCAEISPTDQIGFAYQSDWLNLFQNNSSPPNLSGLFTRFQRCFLDMSDPWPDMFGKQYDRCNLNSIGLLQPFFGHIQVLTLLCHLREISSVSGLSWFGVLIPVWPVWWISLLWQLQRLVSPDSYKRQPTPSLVGCWFLIICILFQQPLELSPSTLCEI